MILRTLAACAAISAPPALAGDFPALERLQNAEKADAMVLGVFHFHQTETPDIRLPEHQKALDDITDKIAEYGPTHVGLECRADYEAELNGYYDKWRRGEYELGRNERQQLGFRIAAKMDLPQVHCIDAEFPPAPSFDAYDGWQDFLAYGESRGDDEAYKDWIPLIQAYAEEEQAFMSQAPLPEILNRLNAEGADYSQSRMLLVEISVGVDDNWAGPDFYGRFQGRNARMFAKTQKLADPGDRMLIIVGNAHKRPLEIMFNDSYEFNLIETPEF